MIESDAGLSRKVRIKSYKLVIRALQMRVEQRHKTDALHIPRWLWKRRNEPSFDMYARIKQKWKFVLLRGPFYIHFAVSVGRISRSALPSWPFRVLELAQSDRLLKDARPCTNDGKEQLEERAKKKREKRLETFFRSLKVCRRCWR